MSTDCSVQSIDLTLMDGEHRGTMNTQSQVWRGNIWLTCEKAAAGWKLLVWRRGSILPVTHPPLLRQNMNNSSHFHRQDRWCWRRAGSPRPVSAGLSQPEFSGSHTAVESTSGDTVVLFQINLRMFRIWSIQSWDNLVTTDKLMRTV